MDQKEIELKWQKFWQENKTFEAKADSSKEKYFATVPYPYANSVLHIGHGRSYTAADILIRYQRLLGKNVLFPMGFHISGTPVLAVADGIKRGDEKQIKLTREAISDYITDKKEQDKLLKTFEDPKNIANFFSNTIETSLNSIGISIDWRRQFTTGDKIYNSFIEWQYKKLHEAGILVQSKYPILYSAADGNAVGEDDIKDGDTDKVALSEMTYIMFQIKGTDEHLVAATLRPDSIFGATNLYVKKDMDLVKLKVDGNIWVVSKDSQVKIKHQFDEVEVISEHKGEEFLDKTAIVPIIDKEVPIYHVEFPDSKHGTGIVYSSPADSPHDYINLFELKFPGESLDKYQDKDPLELTPITETFDKKGNRINYKSDIPAYDTLLRLKIYKSEGNEDKLEQAKQELYKQAHFGGKMINCQEFDGTPLKHGQKKTTDKLVELKVGGNYYETSRRAATRGGDEVIVANLDDQWFLNYTSEDIKQMAYDSLAAMDYFPKQLRDTQQGYLEWVSMRPCARRRGIGTPLPLDKDWIIEPLSDSTIYQMLYLFAHIIDREKISSEQLTADLFDYVFLGKGNKKVISEHTKVSEKILDEMREESTYWNGLDFQYTAGAHMSNHLTFSIYHYAMIFPEEFHIKCLTIGGLLIKDGQKISKSKGNGIPISRIREQYGVDLYRLYIAVASNIEAEMDFKDEEIFQLEKRFNKFKDLMTESKGRKTKKYNDFSNTDKWLISKFYSRAKVFFDNMENKKIREAYVAILYEFLNDVTYHQRRTSQENTLDVLRFVFKDYVKIMTPVTPHACEELFEGEEKVEASLAAFDTDLDKYVNREVEDLEAIIENTITTVARMKENATEEPKKIKIVQASKERFELFDKMKEELDKTRDFKTLFSSLTKDYESDKKFIQKFLPKTLGEGLSFYLGQKEEKELFEEVSKFLEEEFKASIEITQASQEKVGNIVPGKPGVILE